MASEDRIRIGISRCLLGDAVRWDGGHKRDSFLADTFGRYVDWVPVCPEVESGLPVPRETMRLVASPEGGATVNGRLVRLVFPRSHGDWTDEMVAYSARRVKALAVDDLDGFILKNNSPSCGMERVKIHHENGQAEKKGRGLFAEALLARYPDLPVEEEGRLSDPRLRENFVERVFAYRRLKALLAGRWTVGDLVRFHTAHKLTLLAHQPSAYRELGRLVAGAKGMPRAALRDEYVGSFMRAMRVIATPAKHANVLQHMLGHLRGLIDPGDRDELLGLIDDHRRGLVPLVVPITLLRHHVRRLGVAYLAGQTYLAPHPRELALRNHV
ncbi:MAG: YbgA family protein [Vicinamibacterales bacterium]